MSSGPFRFFARAAVFVMMVASPFALAQDPAPLPAAPLPEASAQVQPAPTATEAEGPEGERVAPESITEGPVGLPQTAQTILPNPIPPLPPVLELGRAQEEALANNPTLQAAEARVRQAQARVRQALSAYYPQLSTAFSATRTDLPENTLRAARQGAFMAPFASLQAQFQGALTGQTIQPSAGDLAQQALQATLSGVAARNGVESTVKNYEAGASMTWLIFDGFGRRFTNAAARYGVRQTEESLRENQRLVLLAVANAFYNVQLQRENIRIAQADQAFNERQLVDARARRRVGTGSLSEELNFEIRVRAAQSSLLQAKNIYGVAIIGLAALMGMPDSGFPAGTEVSELTTETPEELADPSPLDSLLGYATEHRPDLLAGRFGVRAAHAAVGINRSQYYPTAVAIAARNAQRSDNAKFEEDDFSSTVGVNVSYDLFTGFRRKAQVAEARAAEAETQRLLQNAEINASSEVRQAVQRVLTSREQLLLQRLNMENVQRNRDLVEREYEVGQGSLVRLNEAQRDLIQAQSQLALARVSLRQSWFALKTATGESLVPYTDEAEQTR